MEPTQFVATGGGAIWQWSYSASSSQSKSGTKHREIKRTTETIRVTNDTDPSQYVDVERAKQITFGREDNPKQQQTFTYKY